MNMSMYLDLPYKHTYTGVFIGICVYTYIHSCIHTYIHPYIHTYVNIFIFKRTRRPNP